MFQKYARQRPVKRSVAAAPSQDSTRIPAQGTSRWLLTLLAVAIILGAIGTNTVLALGQTSEQASALEEMQQSGRLKHDLDVVQQLMLGQHEYLYTIISTKPLFRRPELVFPLRQSMRLINDARGACGSKPRCLSALAELDDMLRIVAEKSDILGKREANAPGSVRLGDPQLSEIDIYFYSVLQRLVAVRMQTEAAVDNAVTRSSKKATWVSSILLACGLVAGILLLALIYRNSKISSSLQLTLKLADEARNELFQSKQTLEYVLDHVPQGIAWKDAQHRYVGGNEIFAKDAGLRSKRELVGLSDEDLKWGDDPEAVQAEDAKIMARELTLKHIERSAINPAGAAVWISESKLPLEDQGGSVIGVLRTYEDITARRSAEVLLRLQGRALEASINGIIIAEVRLNRHVIIFSNRAYERITGYGMSEVVGVDCEELFRVGGEPQKWDVVREALDGEHEVNVTLLCTRKDGSRFWNNVLVAPVRDDDGRVTHHVGVVTDVTALVEYQQRLEHQATYDALTALPNRTALDKRLVEGLERARSKKQSISLLFLDLDRFKEVNDSLGHRVGDALLVCVAKRLSALVQQPDFVSRYGGDEFIIVSESGDPTLISATIQKIIAAMSEPFYVEAQELYVEVSIGVSTYPRDGHNADTLLRNADAAMYAAKANGRNGFRFYQPELNVAAAERLQLLTRLRRAIKIGALELAYQPQVEMSTGRLLGAEALVRWKDEELGVVPPAVFIPVAEESGLIHVLGDWVIRAASLQLRGWLDEGLPAIRVSVNVSPLQFERSDIVELVQSALKDQQLLADQLEIEVTEGALLQNADHVSRKLQDLRRMGVTVAIDDFGTGYSSLSYLRRFSVDRIKIDRTFISEIGTDAGSEALTLAVIGVARALNFEVLAEGVENSTQQDFLLAHGCEAAQGFLYSPALGPEGFAALMRASGSIAALDQNA